jgi:phospholipase C
VGRLAALLVVAVALVCGAAGAGAGVVGSEARKPRVPELERIVVIVFENRSIGELIGSPAAPTFTRLASRYALLTRYQALARPSLPNYLALVSGSTHGVTGTCTECVFDARNLADTIEKSGRTWKTYADGLPAPGFTGESFGTYVKRHNPFLYFRSVVSDSARLRRIVPLTAFTRDLTQGTLPDFSLVIPDLCNGMHDCPVGRGDVWLKRFFRPVLGNPQLAGGAVFVTFDEPNERHTIGDGRLATLVLGPLVRPGARSHIRHTHYSLLRTIEDSWRLPRLGRSAHATPVTGVWWDAR